MVYCMENTTTKQGQYATYTLERHAEIGKYAVRNDPTTTIGHFCNSSVSDPYMDIDQQPETDTEVYFWRQ